MRSEHAQVAPTSRRAIREAELAQRRAARSFPGRRLVRGGVLAALAASTVAFSLADDASPGAGALVAEASAVQADLPSTVEALTAGSVDTTPPPSIAAGPVLAGRSAVPAASRADVRSALPGCDGTSRPAGDNGLLATEHLCSLWPGTDGEQLRADAATALAEMNLAFRARFGRDLCVTDGYRTLAEQHIIKSRRGGLAAVPGRSNHGWGLAIDLCRTDTTGEAWDWLGQNGAVYGWENPAWARSGGSGPFEPWHWEYTPGVMESGEYYTS